jgi:hypothetical protein
MIQLLVHSRLLRALQGTVANGHGVCKEQLKHVAATEMLELCAQCGMSADAASLWPLRHQSPCLLADAAAGQTAALLASRGVQLEVIIDEGTGLAMNGIAPFTKQPVALVGTAEKQLQSVQVGTMLDMASTGCM